MANKRMSTRFPGKTVFYNLHIVGLLVVIFCTQACHSFSAEDRQRILNDYAKAACGLQRLQWQKDSISNSEINSLGLRLSELKNEYDNLSLMYNQKINNLNKKKYEAGMHADVESARISKEHEARYGHNITPEYEKKLNAVENNKGRQLKGYERQIEELTRQEESDIALQQKTTGIEQLKNKITSVKKDIQLQFDHKINEYKEQLKEVTQQSDEMIKDLSDTKKKKFMEQKEKIDTNPCGQWK